jgi:hypothetical protein
VAALVDVDRLADCSALVADRSASVVVLVAGGYLVVEA